MLEESSYDAENRESIPLNGRTTIALASWRTSRLATEATTSTRVRGRGRGRTRGTGRTTETGPAIRRGTRGIRKRGAKWLPFGDGGASTSAAPVEEYQNVEINNTQEAPEDCSN